MAYLYNIDVSFKETISERIFSRFESLFLFAL